MASPNPRYVAFGRHVRVATARPPVNATCYVVTIDVVP